MRLSSLRVLEKRAKAGKPMNSLCTRRLGVYADRVFFETDSLELWVMPPTRAARGQVGYGLK